MFNLPRPASIFGAILFGIMSCGIAAADYTITILHTNDIKSRIGSVNADNTPCSTTSAEADCLGGIARLKAKIDERRRALERVKRPVLVLNAGNHFEKSKLLDAYEGEAMVEFYNLMDFDAVALGELDFQLPTRKLATFIDRADFDVLGSNAAMMLEPDLREKLSTYAIVRKGGEKIALVSVVDQDAGKTLPKGSQVVFSNVIQYLQTLVPEIEAQGINKIIALTSLGLNKDVAIAEAVPGIDIIVGGKSNTVLSNSDENADGPYPIEALSSLGRDVRIVQTGGHAKYLGELRITFDDDGYVKFTSGNPHLLDQTVTPNPHFSQRASELLSRIEVVAEKKRQMASALPERTKKPNSVLAPLPPQNTLPKARPDNQVASDVKDGFEPTDLDGLGLVKFVRPADIIPTKRPQFVELAQRTEQLESETETNVSPENIVDAPGRYTVKQDDTLWIIAGKVYGDSTKWELIRDANGVDRIRTMKLGSVLIIPALPNQPKKLTPKEPVPKKEVAEVVIKPDAEKPEQANEAKVEVEAKSKAKSNITQKTVLGAKPVIVEETKPAAPADDEPVVTDIKKKVEVSGIVPPTEENAGFAVVIKPPVVTKNPNSEDVVLPATAPPPTPKPQLGKEKSYTVQKDDTLWIIAGKVYGDPTQWQRIQDANGSAKIKNMKIGSTLIIPQ